VGESCKEREKNCPSGVKFGDLSLRRVTRLFPNIGTEGEKVDESPRSGQRWVLALLSPPQCKTEPEQSVWSVGRDWLEPLYCFDLNRYSGKKLLWN